MKEIITWVVIIALVAFSGFLLMKLQAMEGKISAIEAKMQYWDKAVEILEDCLEYNTLGECKQKYPQYREQFQ